LAAQISQQTIDVIFLFFSVYSSVIRNFVYCIHSYRSLSENIFASNHADGFCFLSEDNIIAIVIVTTFNVIVIDCIEILFIRNRACGKQS